MTSGPTDARPLQVRIADDIRAKIENGEYVPGQQIPTLDGLAAEYLCSHAAIRMAIGLLKQQGLLVTRQGSGTFVRERSQARRHGRNRYSRRRWTSGSAILVAEAARQGFQASQLMRFLGAVPAPAIVAERLRTEAGASVYVRRRTTLIDGRPNQLADSYYPMAVVDAVPRLQEEDTGPGGGFARIEEAGYRLEWVREEISIRMPSGPESVALRLPAGTPVAELVRTVRDANGQPIEVMLAVIAGDTVVFDDEFPIPDLERCR